MTTNILIYHGKHGNQYWVVDTEARLAHAEWELFQVLDDLGCYDDAEAEEAHWVTAARSGSSWCARKLFDAHNSREYECWEIVIARSKAE